MYEEFGMPAEMASSYLRMVNTPYQENSEILLYKKL